MPDAPRLGWRLLPVLLVAVLPLLALVGLGAEATRHATLAWLEAELSDAARQAARREADDLARAAALLDTLAASGPADCAALAPRLAGAGVGLAIHRPDGTVLCAEAAIDGAHLRAALAAPGRLAVAPDPAGLVLARTAGDAVIALLLPNAHLPPLTLPLRRDQAVRRLVDPEDGTVLAAQGGDTGMPLSLPPVLAALRLEAPGVVAARDAAGQRRLVAHAPVATPAGRLALLLDLPHDSLLAEADARRADQILAGLAMALLGLLAARLLAERALLRPVGALLARRAAGAQLASLRPAGEWLRQQADLAAVANASGEMFLRLDAGLRVLYASPATRGVLGYAPSEVIDADLAAEPGWGACQAQLDRLRRGEAVDAPCRLVARRRDDTEVRLEIRASRLADGGFILACRDIGAEHALREELAAANARLAALGHTDVETGLANRARFDQALAEELRRARRAQEPLALILLRLAEPDDVAPAAKAVAAMLRRPGDLAARLNRNHFGVLLPTTDRIGVQRLAERLQAAIPGRLGACSLLPQGDDTPDSVLDLARAALEEEPPVAQASVAVGRDHVLRPVG